MTVLYKSSVTEIGELVPSFIAEGMLVFFGESAPEELRTFCIIHKLEHAEGQVKEGDFVSIDGHEFEILSVGSVANDNLYNLGHLLAGTQEIFRHGSDLFKISLPDGLHRKSFEEDRNGYHPVLICQAMYQSPRSICHK